MDQLTEKGQLIYGIEFDGKLHFDFEVRLPMVRDNIAAIEFTDGRSGMRVSTAMYAIILLSLGAIPKEKITYQLLSEGLVDEDFDAVSEAVDRLKKKRMQANPALKTSESPDSSSDNMELPATNSTD